MPSLAASGRGAETSLGKAATVMAAISLLSPIAGLFVEISLAWRFGSSGTVDAYRTCSLLLSFGTALFFTFLLPHVIVPMLAQYRARGEEAEGWRAGLAFGNSVSAIALCFAAYVWVNPAPLGRLLGPGLTGVAWAETVSLIPYFVLAFAATLWCGVLGGILNMYRVFAITPMTQLISNLAIAVAVLAASKYVGGRSIAIGVAIGFGIMVLAHANSLYAVARRAGIQLLNVFRPGHFQRVLGMFGTGTPMLIMIVASVLGNVILNQNLSRLPTGNLARFGYATKLLVIIGFGPTALATVLFPSLSDAKAMGREERFRELATKGIRVIFLITFFLSAALYPLKETLMRMLFHRGAMGTTEVHETAVLFGILLIQTAPGNLLFFLYKVSFASGDSFGPAVPACFNALASFLFLGMAMAWKGPVGVVIAVDLIQWSMMLGLLAYLIARFHIVDPAHLLGYCLKLLPLCAVLVACSAGVHKLFAGESFLSSAAELLLAGVCTLAVGYVAARWLGITEAEELGEMASRRLLKWRNV